MVDSNRQDRASLAKMFKRMVMERFGDRVHTIILFGSVAKGTDNEDSDIDIIILSDDQDLQKDINEVIFDFIVEYHELPVPLIYRPRDFERYGNYSFYRTVQEEGIVI